MLSQRKILFAAATVALTLGVTACGSSNGDDNAPPPAGAPAPPPPPGPTSDIPPSAGFSVAAFIAFLQGLAASDTAEPLALGNFTPPTDDTTESQPL